MRTFLFSLILGFTFSGFAMACDDARIYGYVEKATLVQQDVTLSAKLDTGAKSSSLNAIDITRVEENGVSWVYFKVPMKQGKPVAFRCEYVGRVAIKSRATENGTGGPIRRPVVLMPVRLGGEVRMIRVNLTNRKRFIYPLLLGREALIAFGVKVDPSRSFMLKNSEQPS